MEELGNFLMDRYMSAIEVWAASVEGIYAFGIYIDENSAPYRPASYLTYNTLSYTTMMVRQGIQEDEVKWNFAYWPKSDMVGVDWERKDSISRNDPSGRSILDGWIKSHSDNTTEAMQHEFAALCVSVAQSVMRDSRVLSLLHRDVPLIIFDDRYDEGTCEVNQRLNIYGSLRPFLDWLRSDAAPIDT